MAEVIQKKDSKRLSINLPTHVFDELQGLANHSHRSMTELVRDAFALAMIAYRENESGNKLTVTDRSGKPIKEIVLVR